MPMISSSCFEMAMFFSIETRGGMPVWMAAFSAGSPKASQPKGFNTL